MSNHTTAIYAQSTHEELAEVIVRLLAESGALKVENTALRAQRVPMTDTRAMELSLGCGGYGVLLVRSTEEFHNIKAKP